MGFWSIFREKRRKENIYKQVRDAYLPESVAENIIRLKISARDCDPVIIRELALRIYKREDKAYDLWKHALSNDRAYRVIFKNGLIGLWIEEINEERM